jgi:glycosyltransferase involved in cell wall biosynthesis
VSQSALNILQVSTWERWGGAEAIAWALFKGLRARQQDCWLAVRRATSGDPHVVEIPNGEDRSVWYRLCRSPRWNGRRIRYALELASEPARMIDRWRGHEEFRFPGTHRILNLTPRRPDIVHAHNLHGEYFDLRALPWLSREVSMVLTLHDAWMLSGHCSHSFECERWKTGCGQCPDLSIYPAVRRDATAYNWNRKRDIYAGCERRVYVSTPSAWLMRRVKESMLAPAIAEWRVIPNGVDLKVFRPGDRREARRQLNLPPEARVLLFAASGIRKNPFKDFQTLREAVAQVAQRAMSRNDPNSPLILIALGDSAPSEQIGQAQVQFVPFENDPAVVASYNRAADLYLHAARVDTFPTTVLEALACGTPVVATAVGGIPEQVKSLLPVAAAKDREACPSYDANTATGILVPPGQPNDLSQAISMLLEQDELRAALAANAARDAAVRFCAEKQCDAYLSWYESINGQRIAGNSSPQPLTSARRLNEMSHTG